LASLSLSTDLAANDGSGNIVAYSGYTIPTGAAPTIASNTASNVKIDATSTGNPTVGAGTTDLHNIVFTDTVARTLTIASGNTLRLGTAGAIIKTQNNANALTVGASGSFLTAGGPNSGTPGELILNANATTPDVNGMVVASLIADNGAGGVVTLVKTGQAAVQMNAANTYSGGSYIESGRLRANAVGGFGTGPVYVANGASSYINAAGTYSNNFFISGKAFYEGGAANGTGIFSSGAIRLATNGIILSGTITLTGDSAIGARGASGAGSTISGQITGPFGLEFNNNGTTNGIIILSNATNNWSGNTTLSAGVVRVGASEVIPNGAGKGNVVINGSNDTTVTNNSVLDLNGFTETINGLSSTGTLTKAVVTSNLAGTGTLIVGDNNANASYGGIIQNGTTPATMLVAVNKIGTGTQTFSGTNTYTGDTNINAGALLVTGSSAAGNMIVNAGGTLGGNGDGAVTGLVGALSVNGGTVYPGIVAGDFAKLAANSLNIHRGGLKIDLGPGLASDVINDLGALSIGDTAAPTLTLAGTPAAGTYDILNYAGTLTKTADFIISGPQGFNYALNYATAGKVLLNVTPVPEPAAVLLAISGMLGLAVLQKRRKS
jgi:autotransporter-associated beta strand protein